MVDYDQLVWRDPDEDLEVLPIKNLRRYERRLASLNSDRKRLLTIEQEDITCDICDLVTFLDDVTELSLWSVPYQNHRVS